MAGVRREFSSRWAQGGVQVDPADIKTELGWIAEKPPYQYFNWVQARADDMLAHLEEQGVASWFTGTAYLIGGLCMGSNDLIYRAVQANAGVDPTSDGGTNWLLYIRTSTASNPGIVELATTAEVATGTDTSRAVTPAGLVSRAASPTATGLVELATPAEVITGTDTDRAVTPAGLAAKVASEAVRGIVELASAAEVLAGTDNARAVSPAGLGALASTLAQTGYRTFAGGLIVQWGIAVNVIGTTHDVLLPVAFPNTFFIALCSSADRVSNSAEASPAAKPQLLTHVRLGALGTVPLVYWVAIGN